MMSNNNIYIAAYDEFERKLLNTLDPNESSLALSRENYNFNRFDTDISNRNKEHLGKIYYNVVNLLNDNHCANYGPNIDYRLDRECIEVSQDVNIDTIGSEQIMDLMRRCGIQESKVKHAALAFADMYTRFQINPGKLMFNSHSTDNYSIPQNQFITNKSDLNSIYAPGIINSWVTPNRNNYSVTQEAFGTTIDNLIPDVRMVLSLTIMKFHSGILNRMLHRLPTKSPLISYLNHYLELYNYHDASDKNHDVRNSASHRIPLIDLYLDSSMVNAKLKRIEPLKVNDTGGNLLYADNILKFQVNVPMYDLASVAGKIGYDHIDHTDLVGEGVFIESVYLQLVNGADTEIYEVNLKDLAGSRLTLSQNNSDSGDRSANINKVYYSFLNTEKTNNGTASNIFATLLDNECIVLEIYVAANINLKTALANASAWGTFRATTRDKTEPSDNAKDIATALNADGGNIFLGYKLDARYSEENMRRSTISTVINSYSKAFEIPPGINVFMDFGMQQSLPETIMAKINEVISLGQDDRAIDIIIETLNFVFNGNQREAKCERLLAKDRLSANYAAGMQVRPTVYIGDIDMSLTKNIRHSDLYGDIRNYVEYQLLKILSLLMTKSFYNKQIDDGEVVTFVVLTSPIIGDLLLGTPHIHPTIEKAGEAPADGVVVERARTLPNGVRLNIVTSHYTKLRNKIIAIPFRPNKPDSELNFGHNWDYGAIVATYTNTMYDGAHKRLYANSRELPVPTNPIGAIIEVKNLDSIIEHDTVIGMLDILNNG